MKHTNPKPILNAICDHGFGVLDCVILHHGLPLDFGEPVLKPTNAIHDLGAFDYVLATIIDHSPIKYDTCNP